MICNVEMMLLKLFRVVCLSVSVGAGRIRFMQGKNDKNAEHPLAVEKNAVHKEAKV